MTIGKHLTVKKSVQGGKTGVWKSGAYKKKSVFSRDLAGRLWKPMETWLGREEVNDVILSFRVVIACVPGSTPQKTTKTPSLGGELGNGFNRHGKDRMRQGGSGTFRIKKSVFKYWDFLREVRKSCYQGVRGFWMWMLVRSKPGRWVSGRLRGEYGIYRCAGEQKSILGVDPKTGGGLGEKSGSTGAMTGTAGFLQKPRTKERGAEKENVEKIPKLMKKQGTRAKKNRKSMNAENKKGKTSSRNIRPEKRKASRSRGPLQGFSARETQKRGTHRPGRNMENVS